METQIQGQILSFHGISGIGFKLFQIFTLNLLNNGKHSFNTFI
jgi:hypothetical protein